MANLSGRRRAGALALGAGLLLVAASASAAMASTGVATRISYMRLHGATPFASSTSNLSYHGGTGGIGVETAPKVYLVLWGSQWNSNDPSGESALLQSFFSKVGGSAWNNSVTQYCQGVASGTVFCNGAGTPAGNQTGILAGVWADNAKAAPSKPRQSQLAA